MDAARKLASYEDLLALPANVVGEIIFGALYTHPRPAAVHANASSVLGEELGNPFRRGKGGPGGWILLDEPELHLGAEILVPDLAGWRRERLPEQPATPYIDVVPDWICEVLSPSTEKLDRGDKLKVYAREGVKHVWLVNPVAKTLEVLLLDGSTYRILAVHSESAKVRAVPFDAIELELQRLWEW